MNEIERQTSPAGHRQVAIIVGACALLLVVVLLGWLLARPGHPHDGGAEAGPPSAPVVRLESDIVDRPALEAEPVVAPSQLDASTADTPSDAGVASRADPDRCRVGRTRPEKPTVLGPAPPHEVREAIAAVDLEAVTRAITERTFDLEHTVVEEDTWLEGNTSNDRYTWKEKALYLGKASGKHVFLTTYCAATLAVHYSEYDDINGPELLSDTHKIIIRRGERVLLDIPATDNRDLEIHEWHNSGVNLATLWIKPPTASPRATPESEAGYRELDSIDDRCTYKFLPESVRVVIDELDQLYGLPVAGRRGSCPRSGGASQLLNPTRRRSAFGVAGNALAVAAFGTAAYCSKVDPRCSRDPSFHADVAQAMLLRVAGADEGSAFLQLPPEQRWYLAVASTDWIKKAGTTTVSDEDKRKLNVPPTYTPPTDWLPVHPDAWALRDRPGMLGEDVVSWISEGVPQRTEWVPVLPPSDRVVGDLVMVPMDGMLYAYSGEISGKYLPLANAAKTDLMGKEESLRNCVITLALQEGVIETSSELSEELNVVGNFNKAGAEVRLETGGASGQSERRRWRVTMAAPSRPWRPQPSPDCVYWPQLLRERFAGGGARHWEQTIESTLATSFRGSIAVNFLSWGFSLGTDYEKTFSEKIGVSFDFYDPNELMECPGTIELYGL